jgi:DNA polymerase-1
VTTPAPSTPDLHPDRPPRTVITDGAALSAIVPDLMAAEAIAVDLETTALSPFDGRARLVTLGIPGHTYLVDAFAVADLAPLKPVLESPKPFKVLHNAKFDTRWLQHHFGITLGGLFDTMLAAQLLGDMWEVTLAKVTEHYLGITLDKTQQLSDWSGRLSEQQLDYAAKDVEVLLPLRRALRPLLLEAGLARAAALEFGVVPMVAAMENAGVHLDVPAWNGILAGMREQHAAAVAELQSMLAGTRRQLTLFADLVPVINLNSTQQLQRALAELGVNVPDTHERTLQTVIQAHPIVPKILEYRGIQKAISSYGEGLLNHIHPLTGRIHANFQQLATFTGRFSCSSPNLQNIPNTPEYRGCFTAPEGHKLVIADYSQIELRILAELTHDQAFRRAFNEGLDLHKMTASDMFGIPMDAVTKTQRNQAKGINFGLAYGRGAVSLASVLGVEPEVAKALIAQYFKSYRRVGDWLEATGRTAVREKELRSLSGRRARWNFDETDRQKVGAAERQGKNFPIQATNADIIKAAMIQLPQALQPLGARLVNCVHDELVVEAPTETAEQAALAVKQVMEDAGRAYLKEVPVVVEVAVDDAWTK